MSEPIVLRAACFECGHEQGTYRVSGLQRPVHCANCGTYQKYNASRQETGEATTSVRSMLEIPSSQRQRILERDAFRCVMCGRAPSEGVTLQVDHLVSRGDCAKYGIGTRAEINDDTNLATTCDECNLGHGQRSIAPVALLALSVRIAQRRRKQAS